MNDLRQLAEYRLQFVQARVLRRGIFKVEFVRGLVALVRNLAHQRLAASVEICLNARNFRAVFIIAATLEAWRQTHLHLRVDAAWKCRVRMQVVHTTAHLEEVERVVGKLFRSHTRRKRTVIERLAISATQTRRDGSPRIFVLHVQLHQGRETQPQPIGISLRKGAAQEPVEQEPGFEVRTGGRVFDPADQAAQIQPFRAFFGRAQQPKQASPQVGGFADVRLRAALSTQKEDRGARRDGGEELMVAACIELKPVRQHTGILDGIRPRGTQRLAGPFAEVYRHGATGRGSIRIRCSSWVKNSTARGPGAAGQWANLPRGGSARRMVADRKPPTARTPEVEGWHHARPAGMADGPMPPQKFSGNSRCGTSDGSRARRAS